jgi:mannitol-1-phosphate 5-dehydrogenase
MNGTSTGAWKAVVVGAGRIGCGFIGQLLRASGAEVVFVGRDAIAANLSKNGGYRVRLTGRGGARDVEVDGVRAVPASDLEAAAREIATADLVAVSVGPSNLASVAPLVAAGLARRTSPVNVVALENLADAGPRLRALVARADADALRLDHGFSGAVVSRVVARRVGEPSWGERLLFVGDAATEFAVHGPSLRAPLPPVEGMRLVEDFEGAFLKKLYVFSAGHATTAYLGALKGYNFVHAAIRDPEIRRAVLAAMEEGRRGIAARYGEALAGSRRDLDEIVERFENAALNDPIARVGRDPQRKLGRDDRLVGAARLAAGAGVRPRLLALSAAAALCFGPAADREAQALQARIAAEGAGAVVREVTGLDPDAGLGGEVVAGFRRLSAGRGSGALLLSLERRMWSAEAQPDAAVA